MQPVNLKGTRGSRRKPSRGSVKRPGSSPGSHLKWAMLALGAGLLASAGCIHNGPGMGPEVGPVEPEVPLAKVVERVNENAARMDFTLEVQGDADARHMRANGKPEPFHGRAKILFRKPRDLYMKLEHTLDEIMQIGSNQSEFWVWKKVNEDRYWWGRHDQMTPEAEADLPVRPRDVMEVLGLGDLPTQADPKTGPLFQVLPRRYLLTFVSAKADGTMYPSKKVWIDRSPPYLLRELEYLSPAGRVLARTEVGDYRQVNGSAVMIPFHVDLEWPSRDEFLKMSFDDVQRYDRDPTRAFTSPLQQGRHVGEQIRVDRAPAPRAGAPRQTDISRIP